jgi:hypothetical protein
VVGKTMSTADIPNGSSTTVQHLRHVNVPRPRKLAVSHWILITPAILPHRAQQSEDRL